MKIPSRTSLRTSGGVALISSLLVMGSVMAFGLGSLFLTQMNLHIGENVRSSTVARYHAQAGLEAALLILEQHALTHGSLPTSDSSVLKHDASAPYQLRYAREGNSAAVVRVTGLSPNGQGKFVSEARVVLNTQGTMTPHPSFSRGLIAKGTLSIESWGNHSQLIGAQLHGAQGYRLNNFQVTHMMMCHVADRDPTSGHCNKPQARPENDALAAISGLAGYPQYLCQPFTDARLCSGSMPTNLLVAAQDPFATGTPHEIRVDTLALRNRRINERPCTKTVSGSLTLTTLHQVHDAGFRSGAVVCLGGGVSFPANVELSGVSVIAEQAISFGGRATLRDTTLVSKQGAITLHAQANTTLERSFLYALSPLQLNTQVEVSGSSTLVSGSSITFRGKSAALASLSGPLIGLAVIAQQDIILEGSSDLYATLHAGRDVTLNGSGTLYGGVVAERNITAHGGLRLDTGLAAANLQLSAVPAGLQVSVISRR